MSEYAYRPRGGMEGIAVNNSEIRNTATSKWIVPLPFPDNERQDAVLASKAGCMMKHAVMENAQYWEDESGSHGWCCGVCGEILQWG